MEGQEANGEFVCWQGRHTAAAINGRCLIHALVDTDTLRAGCCAATQTKQVRGVAMNSVDHPMGGGTAGGRPSCSPWGLNSKGKKTRKKHKASSKWILVKRTKRS